MAPATRGNGKGTSKGTGRKTAVGVAVSTLVTEPDHDAVARLAYQFFESEGRPSGRALEHWLRAKSQLQSASVAG